MAEVSLYNHAGVSGTYSTGRGIRLYTEGGSIQDFFPGKSEELTVELDFSEGDMIIEPSENKLYEKVIIPKPANLIPENIAEGADIAGVEGNLVGGGVQLEGDFLKYVSYQLDVENSEIIICNIMWSKLYADKNSYDINVPDTLGAYRVVIASEGVTF